MGINLAWFSGKNIMRSIMGINLAWFSGKNIMRSIMRIDLTVSKNLLLSKETRTDFAFEDLWPNCTSNLGGHIHPLGYHAVLQHNNLCIKVKIFHSSKSLFATKQVALLGQSLSKCLVTIEGSSHLLVLQPLVADKLQAIITLGCL